jgi:hypothetical protein
LVIEDVDIGIYPTTNTRLTAIGDYDNNTEVSDVWNRTDSGGIQNISILGVEWTSRMIISISGLQDAMLQWQSDNG